MYDKKFIHKGTYDQEFAIETIKNPTQDSYVFHFIETRRIEGQISMPVWKYDQIQESFKEGKIKAKSPDEAVKSVLYDALGDDGPGWDVKPIPKDIAKQHPFIIIEPSMDTTAFPDYVLVDSVGASFEPIAAEPEDSERTDTEHHLWDCDCSKCGYEAVEDVHEEYLKGRIAKDDANFKLEQIAQGYGISDFPKLPKRK